MNEWTRNTKMSQASKTAHKTESVESHRSERVHPGRASLVADFAQMHKSQLETGFARCCDS